MVNRLAVVSLFLLLLLTTLTSAQMPGIDSGKPAPDFHLLDQFGKRQSLASLMGSKGLVLLFFRSADW
jgi:hypothetical protein